MENKEEMSGVIGKSMERLMFSETLLVQKKNPNRRNRACLDRVMGLIGLQLSGLG